MPFMMRLSLSAPLPPRRLACWRSWGLLGPCHISRLQRPVQGPGPQLTPRASAGSSNSGGGGGGSSSGQPGSEAASQQAASLTSNPDRLQRQRQQQWQQAYNQVLAFQQAHGRLPGTNASNVGRLLEGEAKLGMWCALQRRRKDGSKGPLLSAGEKAALQAIPGWDWGRARPTRMDWWQRLQEVEAFVEQHERLPRKDAGKSSPLLLGERQLGNWCGAQRQCWKGQQQPPLSPAQEAALEAIPGWFWQKRQVLPWELQYQRVVAFQQQHGRLPRRDGSSSQPLVENERHLGGWCDTQRQRYRGQRQSLLLPEQEAALAAIPGWFWAHFKVQDWEQQYQRVVAFQQQHGRLPRQERHSSQPLVENEGQLRNWCDRQRARYKGLQQPPLLPEQEAALAAIPGWYWEQIQRQDWEEQRQLVVAFQQQHGRLPRPHGSRSQPLLEDEGQLGHWCNSQRQRHRGHLQPPLLPGQEAALAAIPGWFWEQWQEEDWEQQRQRVVAFQQQYGRLPRVIGSSSLPLVENERRLGKWRDTQRQRYKGQKQPPLSAEQQSALAAIPGWFWFREQLQQQDWEQHYQRVVAFWHGHGRLPRDTGSISKPLVESEQHLGRWCREQRGRKQNPGTQGPLAPSQVAALESIEGWWWRPDRTPM